MSEPFVVHVGQLSVQALAKLDHVHHIDGSCFKNRGGTRCEQLPSAPELSLLVGLLGRDNERLRARVAELEAKGAQ